MTTQRSRNRDYVRRELLTCLGRREEAEEALVKVVQVASNVQKLFEDWLSSSSSRGSLGQVTRGIRQRLGRSSYAS